MMTVISNNIIMLMDKRRVRLNNKDTGQVLSIIVHYNMSGIKRTHIYIL